MSNSPIRSGKASKVIDIALVSVTLSFGIVATAAASSAATADGGHHFAGGPAAAKAPEHLASAAPGRSVRPRGTSAPCPTTPANVTCLSSWSGYMVTGERYTEVQGSWIVPTANCGAKATSSSVNWVGLGGYGLTNDLQQVGTSSFCTDGFPQYNAWTQSLPAQKVYKTIPHNPSPGDLMFAYVQSNSTGTSYTMWLIDETAGWSGGVVGASVSPAYSDVTAEWVTERPTCGSSCSNLANFGTVNFSAASAIGNGNGGTISAFPYTPIDMDNGNVEDEVSGLNAGGYAFSIAYEHA
jgi:Peptidase A4 family